MKNIRLSLFITFILVCLISNARTVELKMSECKKPYAVSINNVTRSLNTKDSIILNFDKKGKFIFDRTVRARCNIEIKGLGIDETKIILTEGIDNSGKKLFSNDCYFNFDYPKAGNQGSVFIHDIGIEMQKHSELWWPNSIMHLFKITHANKVHIIRTKSSLHNAIITNFDLRSCSNVTIENNEIINYNYSEGGGCVWSRDNQRNVVVRNNVFHKFGKDEVIAVWGTEKTGDFVIENVDISNNTIYYGNYLNSGTENTATMLMSLCHFRGDYVKDSHFKIDNVSISDNNIYLDYAMRFVMMLKFDDLVTSSNINLCDNKIHKSLKCTKSMTREIVDFKVEDGSSSKTSISISGNSSTCERINNEKYELNSNVFIALNQGKIEANNNNLDCENRLQFFYLSDNGGELTMNNNQVKGLYVLGTIKGSGQPLKRAVISADGNEFTGDTRIYCRNIDELTLNFTNNIFNSSNYHFFLQEAATNTSIKFDGNTINSLTGKGTMFANYTGTAYKFKEVRVSNNVFRGISKKELENAFVKVGNKTFKNNIYR
ncbi:MAG: hypothetical protein IKT03_04375 [Muribaculaceae bacterium]|nr:hypothetical protein [Muribaculaceae bacterium]